MKEARFQTAVEGGVQCMLCPHHCRLRNRRRSRREEAAEPIHAGNLLPVSQLHGVQPLLQMVPEQFDIPGRSGGCGLRHPIP